MTALYPTWTLGSLVLTDYPFSVEFGGSHGAPESITELRQSLLADGDLVSETRAGNREITIVVIVEGADLREVASNEALLRAECRKPTELTFSPGDDFAPASVFQVLAAQMVHARNDTEETYNLHRWELTLTCAPFARSATATVVQALVPPPLTPVTTVIDDCTSATPWSAFEYVPAGVASPIAVTVASGAVTSTTSSSSFGQSMRRTFTGSVFTTSDRYLLLDVAYSNTGSAPVVTLTIDGSTYQPALVQSRSVSAGRALMTFDVGAGTVTAISVQLPLKDATRPRTSTLTIYDLSRTNTVPQVTTREVSAVVEAGGTERTPCSLTVNPAAGESMGFAIVHTSPEIGLGYSPALRQRRASGNTVTTNTALVSGASEPVTSTPVVAQIPLTSLPEDGYSLVALMKSSVVGTFPVSWQVRTFFSGNYLGGYTGTAQASFGAVGTWTLVPLAVVTLPPVRASQQAFVQLDLNRVAVGSEVIELDEWWAFRTGDDCGLTIVSSAASFLWLDSPGADSPVPRVWVGTNGDRSDARHPAAGLINMGNHVLHPDGTSIFVATSGIANPSVTASYYKRWHSNAAE